MMKDEFNQTDIDIVAKLLSGKSTLGVALDIGKTERTVQMRWKKIMKKLLCKTAVQAAVKIGAKCHAYPPTKEEITKILRKR
ncbi:MAG: hypothetical protein AAGA27_06520 [Pseudomonadota bacterium]